MSEAQPRAAATCASSLRAQGCLNSCDSQFVGHPCAHDDPARPARTLKRSPRMRRQRSARNLSNVRLKREPGFASATDAAAARPRALRRAGRGPATSSGRPCPVVDPWPPRRLAGQGTGDHVAPGWACVALAVHLVRPDPAENPTLPGAARSLSTVMKPKRNAASARCPSTYPQSHAPVTGTTKLLTFAFWCSAQNDFSLSAAPLMCAGAMHRSTPYWGVRVRSFPQWKQAETHLPTGGDEAQRSAPLARPLEPRAPHRHGAAPARVVCLGHAQ